MSVPKDTEEPLDIPSELVATQLVPLPVVCSTKPLVPAEFVESYSAPVIITSPAIERRCDGEVVPIPTFPPAPMVKYGLLARPELEAIRNEPSAWLSPALQTSSEVEELRPRNDMKLLRTVSPPSERSAWLSVWWSGALVSVWWSVGLDECVVECGGLGECMVQWGLG